MRMRDRRAGHVWVLNREIFSKLDGDHDGLLDARWADGLQELDIGDMEHVLPVLTSATSWPMSFSVFAQLLDKELFAPLLSDAPSSTGPAEATRSRAVQDDKRSAAATTPTIFVSLPREGFRGPSQGEQQSLQQEEPLRRESLRKGQHKYGFGYDSASDPDGGASGDLSESGGLSA